MLLTRRALAGLWAALSWPFRRATRMTALAWLIGTFTVGASQLAYADDDFIRGPDLGSAGGQTPFEAVPLTAYTLPPLNLSDAHHGAPYVEEGMWSIFHYLGNAVLFILLALLRGAITALQWFLSLTVYRDNASQIDGSIQSVAGAVFWPLITVSVAVAGVSMYGRMRREGNGSIVNDLVWVVAAGVLAVTFATTPSRVLDELDNARTLVADGAMKGYSAAAGNNSGGNPAGLPTVTTGSSKDGAVRSLSDSMWATYGVTPWCFAAFGTDLSVCKDVGHEYLTDSDRWKAIDASTHERGQNDDQSPPCADELKGNCDQVRGQSAAQIGIILFTALVTLPLVIMLLVLVVTGIIALAGFLLLALLGILFMLLWMIPGKPRAIGTRWFEALIGSLLQSVIITACVGGVMVLSGIFNNALSTYGFFMVGLLNLAVFGAALKVRGMFENLTGMSSISGASGAGGMGGYMAMRALGSVGRGVGKLTGAAAGAGAGAARLAGKAAMHGSGGFMNAGGKIPALQSGNPMTRLRQHFAVPAAPPRKPATATPYRDPRVNAPGELPGARVHATPYNSGQQPGPTSEPWALPTGTRPGSHSARDGHSAVRPTTTALPNPRPSRLALPAAATSTTNVSPTAARVSGQRPGRVFVAPSSAQGTVPSAQRRIAVQPSRVNNLTPPAPRRAEVVVYGQGQNIHTTRRVVPPVTSQPVRR